MEIECEKRITRLEESSKSAHHRLDAMEQMQGEIRSLALGLNSIGSDVKQMKESQATLIDKVAEIELKPAKRWDALTLALIIGIATTVLGFLLGKII